MSTINRRIKVKFRNSERVNHIEALSLKYDRTVFFDLYSLDVSFLLKSAQKYCKSVLNVKLSSSKKSELRCSQQSNKSTNNNNNTQNESSIKNILKSCFRPFSRICKGQKTLSQNCKMIFGILLTFLLICSSQSIILEEDIVNNTTYRNSGKSISRNSSIASNNLARSSNNGYLDKLDNLERSVAAVLIKVAYGTTSTTKRSIPDNSYILGLTTVATPLLTTLRYHSSNQAQHNGARYKTYELDLERDHALPTSAPNADILKSNNNPTYPNPNRHHSSNHDRDRHRHTMQYNSTPMPSIPNLLKKANGQPTIPMYPGDIPSYSPPSRSFFTPPLPPEYQNPFADKPTLRGTNNEGLITNTVPFNNRRPIPPPSLMPGHERIPFRPPDLAVSIGNGDQNANHNSNDSFINFSDSKKPLVATSMQSGGAFEAERKKALNTPSRNGNDATVGVEAVDYNHNNQKNQDISTTNNKDNANKRQEVLPNIRRILGSNGKKGDIPAVLLRQVTQRPLVNYHQPPSSPIVAVDNAESSSSSSSSSGATSSSSNDNAATSSAASPNINKSKHLDSNDTFGINGNQEAVTTPSAAAAIGEAAATTFTTATISRGPTYKTGHNGGDQPAGTGLSIKEEGGAAAAAAASAHTTWTWAWNIHIYLSVVLFTILAVYSLYKLFTYNKLTHLFAQSYFVYIQLILIAICIMRITYLCVDAYNIHATFPIFAAELLLNLPSTFLTVAFAVLILFLFLKSLNHKNNRYSALVRPLTVVVGCGVHVGLCITLHYVESYTLQNHHMYYQQQQQQQYIRRQQQQQHLLQHQNQLQQTSTSLANPPPPRVLSLICQIIYIFICLSLGLLYLYLYRILKRILRSKSQNYIHGYQNLSYAIHITIATALLFCLLAALQIFGAVCISAARPLISQANIEEVDWLQWGYQFSLRLIEIAIITLISWVTGLKTSVGNNPTSSSAIAINNDVRSGINNTSTNVLREKNLGNSNNIHNSHSNVANFFLPCTSSSSQEQFETDYPAICNANTNLHTYTMRTGKLIYDDSYALNSLAGPSANSPSGVHTEYQLQEPMYQRPYDTGSIRSATNHNLTAEYATQVNRYQQQQQHVLNHHHHQQHAHHHMHHMRDPSAYMSTDYMTDATTDHYENPNFDLRTNTTGGAMQKLGKNNISSGSASASGSGSGSGSSQQQMLLFQSDSCYSEPLQENSSYEFNNFERPVFKEKPSGTSSSQPVNECWPEREREVHRLTKSRKSNDENPERRSSNSTNSCSSSNGIRYNSYNSYDRAGQYNGVRKSGTLNSIINGTTTNSGMSTVHNAAPGRALPIKRANGAQTLAHSERAHYFSRNGRNINTINNKPLATNDFELAPNNVCNELAALKQQQLKEQHQYPYNKSEEEDEEDEDEDDVISGNVECTNLISNDELGYCIASDNIITTNVQNNLRTINSHHPQQQQHNNKQVETHDATALAAVSASTSALAPPSSASERVEGCSNNSAVHHLNKPHSKSNALTQICSNVNGIDC